MSRERTDRTGRTRPARLAAFAGWPRPLLTIGLFVVAELVSNMVMEPLLYRQTAGVSQVALLIAIAFWTWLWGPIGLFLATPLTAVASTLRESRDQLFEHIGLAFQNVGTREVISH
jgi:predicted PurR-regulated permease PerM